MRQTRFVISVSYRNVCEFADILKKYVVKVQSSLYLRINGASSTQLTEGQFKIPTGNTLLLHVGGVDFVATC